MNHKKLTQKVKHIEKSLKVSLKIALKITLKIAKFKIRRWKNLLYLTKSWIYTNGIKQSEKIIVKAEKSQNIKKVAKVKISIKG